MLRISRSRFGTKTFAFRLVRQKVKPECGHQEHTQLPRNKAIDSFSLARLTREYGLTEGIVGATAPESRGSGSLWKTGHQVVNGLLPSLAVGGRRVPAGGKCLSRDGECLIFIPNRPSLGKAH